MDNSKNSRKSLSNNNLYVLDADFYPDIWKNDKLMSAMMYTFRPRDVNPEHYEQKMHFWKDLIESYCEYKGTPTITINELKDVFKRKGTSPYCLQEILNQMAYEGNLQDKSSFMEQPKTSWGSWMVDSLIYKPASWGFGKIKEKITGSSSNPDTIYIVKSSVQKQARLLQEHVRNRHTFNNIITMDDLMESSENIDGLSREGILMALQHLSVYSKSAYIEENKQFIGTDDVSSDIHHHKLLIKFAEPHQIALPITEMERSIYNLENTERYLLETINKKEKQLDELLVQVKNCLAEGKKQMAKTFLRKKHVCESEMTKTMNILENIQTMLHRIQNSKSDKEIVQMYKMGSDSIKNILSNNGINLDSVYDIIEDMKEVIEDQEECQSALSAPMRGLNEINESDIESELMDLIKEDKKEDPKPIDVKNKPDLDITDLEMRLRKLRGDFSDLDESNILPTKSQKSLPQI